MTYTDTPLPDLRVDWRADGFSVITNDGFETDTSGWVVTAGINAAATSLTRITTDSYAGSACGQLVTTAVNGSGCNFDFGTTNFVSGRTYRFRVYLKSVSGATGCRVLLGSLGTPADRASWTGDIAGAWLKYEVDWTPSGTRTDVEATVSLDGGSIMTARIDHAEVFEVVDDISAYADAIAYGRSVDFSGGGGAPGKMTVTLRNDDGRFSPLNTSGALYGLLLPERQIWLRATYLAVPYALWAGRIKRIVPNPADRKVELICEDALADFGRAETSLAASTSRSMSEFRAAVLADVGEPVARQALADGVENDIGFTEADQAPALSVLGAINTATAAVHYIRPSVSSSVVYQYVTLDRTDLATGTIAESFADDMAGSSGWDHTAEAVVNDMSVTPVQRAFAGNATVWTHPRIPFTVEAGASRTIWASFDTPVFAQAVSYAATNAPTVNLTAYSRSAKIVITAGGSAAAVSALSITGQAYAAISQETVRVTDAASIATYSGRKPIARPMLGYRIEPATIRLYGRREGGVASDLLSTEAHARGLADWWVYRYKDPTERPGLDVENRFPSQLQRQPGERVSITFALVGASAREELIASADTTIRTGSRLWATAYRLETAPASDTWFVLNTAGRGLDDAGGGPEGKLAY